MRQTLLALDGSIASEETADFLARTFNIDVIELTLTTVIERRLCQPTLLVSELYDSQSTAEARRQLERAAERFDGARLSLHTLLANGKVGDEIACFAAEEQIDLIAVGAPTFSGPRNSAVMSTRDVVAAQAMCSVLSVHPRTTAQKESPLRVCVAYDGTPAANAALVESADVRWRKPPQFHLVTVINDWEDSETSDVAKTKQGELLTARDALGDTASEVQLHLINASDEGEAIVRFTDANEIDLVIVGEMPRAYFTEFPLGPTSQYVLRNSTCSVWLARNRFVEDVHQTIAERKRSEAATH